MASFTAGSVAINSMVTSLVAIGWAMAASGAWTSTTSTRASEAATPSEGSFSESRRDLTPSDAQQFGYDTRASPACSPLQKPHGWRWLMHWKTPSTLRSLVFFYGSLRLPTRPIRSCHYFTFFCLSSSKSALTTTILAFISAKPFLVTFKLVLDSISALLKRLTSASGALAF